MIMNFRLIHKKIAFAILLILHFGNERLAKPYSVKTIVCDFDTDVTVTTSL